MKLLHFSTALASICIGHSEWCAAQTSPVPRPNILIAISDDQSQEHTSAAGCKGGRILAFDRIAREGILFRNGFAGKGWGPGNGEFEGRTRKEGQPFCF